MNISEELQKLLFKEPTYIDEIGNFEGAHYVIGQRELNIIYGSVDGWSYSIRRLDDEFAYDAQFGASPNQLLNVYRRLLEDAVLDEME